MIAIVDYGLGNVRAFLNVYSRLGIPVSVAKTEEDIRQASRLVLPGVGSFDWAMERLNASGMRAELDVAVIDKRTPVLGVCVGMQMMLSGSDEGSSPGLGWIRGRVTKLSVGSNDRKIRTPHMGWNDVSVSSTDGLFGGIAEPRFYFLHSYVAEPADELDELATAKHGRDFCCAIQRGNVLGTQFHPEKSHDWGAALLSNFARMECF
jgi:glutamine amidotransferase